MVDQTVVRQWRSENVIILRKMHKHMTFEERLAEYDGKITIFDYDWGEPQGKEIL